MTRVYIASAYFLLGLSACSVLERSESSGYNNYNDGPSTTEEFYRARRMKAWDEAREEVGLVHSQELTEDEAGRIRARVQLNRMEKNIPNEQLRKQYYSLKPFFGSDAERVYFLRLPDLDSRKRWAEAKGITTEETKFTPDVNKLIENNDVAQGMSKNAVKESWGEPDFVEIAGNPIYGNERWRFNKLVSTEDGYKAETRVIYFEAGRVVGWETL